VRLVRILHAKMTAHGILIDYSRERQQIYTIEMDNPIFASGACCPRQLFSHRGLVGSAVGWTAVRWFLFWCSRVELEGSVMSRLFRLNWLGKGLRAAAMFAVLCGSGPAANAACTYCLSEIYHNPPGSGDEANNLEYVEFFGPANTTWSNKYLVLLENEDSSTNGQIEAIFNLGSVTSGANGYITFTMDNNPYPTVSGVEIEADQNEGFKSSYVTWSGTDYSIENSGFTALLIDKNGGATPAIGNDFSSGSGGSTTFSKPDANWNILDSVGVIGENDELDSQIFGQFANFGPGALNTGSGGYAYSTYRNVDAVTSTFDEIEYVARESNSTADGDWYAGNLTNGDGDYDDAPRNYSVGGDATHREYVHLDGSTPHPFGDDVTVNLGSTNIAPEPGSFVLVFLGVIGFSAARRRAHA
jgi:hypothetical protein